MIDEAVRQARETQPVWAGTPARQRATILRRYAQLIMRNQDLILDTIQLETKKNRLSAFEELLDAAQVAHYYARRGARILKSQRRRGAIPVLTKTFESHLPKGVIGVITPWNYPFTLPSSDVVPAVIAGNTVVLLPDHQTPETADLMLSLMRQAGLPDGVVNIVHGGGRRFGSDLIKQVDFVMFTGSTATGKVVAQQCAERLIGFSAELGGKNPMIVLSDADIEKAAAGAVRACFSNSGQLCVSIERIYVTAEHFDEFVTRFAQHTRDMKLGEGTDWSIDMGPLISADQLHRVAAQVQDAVARGATVVAGGNPRPDIAPTFFEPTILTGVTEAADLYRGETFGPVVAVYSVANDDEAIARANDSEFGLNASMWTRSSGKKLSQITSELKAGTVTINEGYSASWASHDAPMGGMKMSGLGRRHGREGILKYTDSQTSAQQRMRGIAPTGKQSNQAYARMMTRLLGIWNRLS